jgi:hypothetical protein
MAISIGRVMSVSRASGRTSSRCHHGRAVAGQGATAVMVAYNKGERVALKFKIVIDGNEPGYGMPVDWRAVLQVMRHDRLAR